MQKMNRRVQAQNLMKHYKPDEVSYVIAEKELEDRQN